MSAVRKNEKSAPVMNTIAVRPVNTTRVSMPAMGMTLDPAGANVAATYSSGTKMIASATTYRPSPNIASPATWTNWPRIRPRS